MAEPDFPARIHALLEEVDRLREAGLQLWLAAGSAARILENGQHEIPSVRREVAEDVRAQMAAFKATRDRDFFPWEVGEPHDPRFKAWVQSGERLTDLVLGLTVYRREGQRFVILSSGGVHWIPESQYGDDPVLAAQRKAAELG